MNVIPGVAKSYGGRRLLDFVKTVNIKFCPFVAPHKQNSAREFINRVHVPSASSGWKSPEKKPKINMHYVYDFSNPSVEIEYLDGSKSKWDDTAYVKAKTIIDEIVSKNQELSEVFQTEEDEVLLAQEAAEEEQGD